VNSDSEKFNLIINNLPDAFAYHQIVTADDGTPVDYIFLEINDAFEEMTGLKRENIIGKKVTEILPGIEKSEFDWIGTYGKVASSGEPVRFQSFSETLGRWYDVSAYSGKAGYFAVTFHNITSQKELEKDLIESKKRYQLIVNSQQEMICHYLPDTTLIFVNQAYCRTFGLSEAELIGRKFLEHTPSDYREKLVAIISSLTPEQPVITHEHQAVLPDGSICWQEWTDQAIYNETGEIVEYQAVGRDFTDRKQAENEMRKSESLFKKVFEILPIGLWIADKSGKLMQGNPAGVKIWGMEPKVGQSEYGVFKARRLPSREEIAPEDWALAHTVNKGVTIVDELLEIDSFDGKKKIILNYTAPILDSCGEVEAAIIVNQDITERLQAEGKLKKIEWMLSQKENPDSVEQFEVYDQGYGDLTVLNDGGTILKSIGPELLKSFSKDYMELLGTSSAIYEVNGDYAFGIFASGWCQTMDKASRNLCNTSDNIEALNSGQWLCHESCWTDCSKKAILERTQVDIECSGGIRLYAVPIIANGEVVGAINFGYGDPPADKEKLQKLASTYQENYDVLVREAHEYETRPPYIIDMAKKRLHATARLIGTMVEKKLAEDEIRTLNAELEERVRERTAQLETANRELDAFAYSASHDLRGPLNRISGFSEALLEDYVDVLDSQGKDYLQRISNSSQHMGELIDDLLKLSRVSQHKISHEPVEMSVLVNIYLKELQFSDPYRQVEAVITPGLVVEGDTALLRIALENLLNNAWKFSIGKNPARIEFGNELREGKEVFFIRDNGTGFDMKYAEKLFAAFQRLHDAKTYPGTGIGLSIVSRIIQRHGGEIWAEGEEGKGACFYFTLS
jgi:PAS domain S-box-containing protein